jgi:hypothetical protein
MSLVLLVTGCAPKPASIPQVAVDKPAYCAALALSRDPDVRFPEAAIQFLLLGSVKDGVIDVDAYRQLIKQERTYSTQITSADDPPSPAQCVAAYPSTNPAKTFALPDDPMTRLLGCDSLLDGLSVSIQVGEPPYVEQRKYAEMSNAFATDVQAAIAKAHISVKKATQMRDAMLPTMLDLGNSYTVLEACRKAYPPKVL